MIRDRLQAPRAGAIAGIVFSILLIISLVLIRVSVPATPGDTGTWLAHSEKSVRLALDLLPFAGIALLWFIGVLRDRMGALEDRFFATVFLGSGLLFPVPTAPWVNGTCAATAVHGSAVSNRLTDFMSQRWRIESEYAMKVDSSLGLLGVLLEPTTVVTKAWEQVDAIGRRAFWDPRTVLVTGADPIGLFAALLGMQRGDWTFMFLIVLIPVSSLTLCALWVLRTMPVLSPASDSGRISSSNAPAPGRSSLTPYGSRKRRDRLSYGHR